ncbi:MAG: hypothetical protein QM758_25655 [Armatimonas sp.]
MNEEKVKRDAWNIYQRLATNEITREEAANWAMMFIIQDSYIKDDALWSHIETISGADLKISETEYLHHQVDFENWVFRYMEDFKETVGILAA